MGKALSKQSGIPCFSQIIYQIINPAADVDEKRRKNYIFQRTGSEFKQAYWMFRGKLKRVRNTQEHTADCKNKSLRFKAYIFSGSEFLGCKKSKKITIQQHVYHSSQALLAVNFDLCQDVKIFNWPLDSSFVNSRAWNNLIFVLSFFFSSMKDKQRHKVHKYYIFLPAFHKTDCSNL